MKKVVAFLLLSLVSIPAYCYCSSCNDEFVDGLGVFGNYLFLISIIALIFKVTKEHKKWIASPIIYLFNVPSVFICLLVYCIVGVQPYGAEQEQSYWNYYFNNFDEFCNPIRFTLRLLLIGITLYLDVQRRTRKDEIEPPLPKITEPNEEE